MTVAEDKVMNLLTSLNTNQAIGLDHISATFYKNSAGIAYKIITHIVNLSLKLEKSSSEIK